MISYILKTDQDKILRRVSKFHPHCWISLVDPSENDIAQMDEQLQLDESLIRDALDPYEVPRIEKEDGEVYLFTRYLTKSGGTNASLPILFVIDDQCLLTVSKEEIPFLEKLSRRLEHNTTEQKVVVLANMLFIITREYHKLIIDVSKQIQAVSMGLEDIRNQDVVRLVHFENTFNELLSALVPTHIAVGQLLTGKYKKLDETEIELLEDVHLFINQLIEMCRSNLSRIMNIRDASDTILSNKLNATMKFLAGLTLILTVPTMIFSFFGMNVTLPFQHLEVAHLLIIALAVFLSGGLLVLFMKKQLV